MTCYSVQPRDCNHLFVKGYGFLSFAKNMGKNISKNISKNLSSKYSQNHDHAKQSARDVLKGYLCYRTITSQNVPSKTQIKNFFISKKNYVSFPRYSSFCIFNYPMIYQICDVTMSIST